MADTKITALTALTAADPANDVIPIVDVSDTSMAASGTTKKISVNNILGASGTATLASATITGAATVGTTLGVTGVSTFAAGTAALPALTTTGDTNTGIYYPAADTFAVTTGGTERYRVDSGGNLGIGVTPSAWDTSVFKAIQIGTGVGQASVVSRTDNVNNTAYGLNYYYGTGAYRYIAAGRATNYEQASGKHLWNIDSGTQVIGAATSFTQAMTLDASGNLLVGVTSANANGGVLQLKSGITFPATQVAASDANTLDDYEEGTWTPVATGLTNVGAVTYTATYTKIGRVVYINLKVAAVTSTTSVANTTFFSGLPFTPALNSTITAVNEGNVTSLGVGLIATGSTVFTPNWTAVQNATLSGFYYV